MGIYVNVWAWFPLRFILGAAQAMAWTTGETWINHSSSDRARGRTIALFATAIAAGFSLGPFLQRFTGSEGDLPFIAACGAALIIALPPLLALKSEIRSHGAPSARLFQYVRLAPVPMFSNLSFAMIASALMALLPVYGLRLGMPDTEAVELIGWMGVGGIVMPLFVGYLADIMDRRLLLSWFIAVGLVGAALLPFIRDMEPLTWIFMMVFGGFRAGHYSLGVMLLGERFRGADLPSATAIFGVMYGAGSFVGPGLAGAGIDIWDPHGLPLIVAVMYLGFLPLPVIAYLKRRSKI
jgi:MFS family permease